MGAGGKPAGRMRGVEQQDGALALRVGLLAVLGEV